MIRPAALAALTVSVVLLVACVQNAGSHALPTATSHPRAPAGENDAANAAATPAPGGTFGYGDSPENTTASAALRCPALGQSEPGSSSGSVGSIPWAGPGEGGEGSAGGMEAPPPEGTAPLPVPPPANPISPETLPTPAIDSPQPPSIPAGFTLWICFAPYVTPEQIDETAAVVAATVPDARLEMIESDPPVGMVALAGAKACELVVAELQAKTYIAAVSCAPAPVEPPSPKAGNLITVRFTESSRPEDIDEVSVFLRSRGAVVPNAMIMIFPPVLSAEFPEEDPDSCRLAADELRARTYVAAVECVPAAPQPLLPGDSNGIVSATPVAEGPVR